MLCDYISVNWQAYGISFPTKFCSLVHCKREQNPAYLLFNGSQLLFANFELINGKNYGKNGKN